jgi:hypothetical protein
MVIAVAGVLTGCPDPGTSSPDGAPAAGSGGGGGSGGRGGSGGGGGGGGSGGSAGSDARASGTTPDKPVTPDASPVTPDAKPASPDGGTGDRPASGGKLASRVVAYARSSLGNLPALAASVDFHKITHLIITFANPTPTAPLALSSNDADVAKIVTAAHEAGAKVLVALGGATHSAEILPVLAPDKVQAFVQTVVTFMEAHDFDGVDIDVEDAGVPPANYEALVTGLRAALEPKQKLLSAALATWFDSQVTAAAIAKFDFISVMAYDACNNSSPTPCDHSPYQLTVDEVDHFVGKRKVPADKVVVGVPFYGYCWGTGCTNPSPYYSEIVMKFPGAESKDFIDTPEAKLSYNGRATVEKKAKLGRMNGGVMFWHLAADAPAPSSLLDVIGSALQL